MASFGSKARPPISAAYSLVLKSDIRTITGYPDADIHAAILRMPNSEYFLEILEYRNVEKAPVDTRTANPGTCHIAFYTDDCDALYADLTAKGVRSVSAPVTPTIGPNTGGRAVYMIDPDGIRVEFIQTFQTFDGKPNC